MSTEATDAELSHEVQGLPLTGYSDPYMRTLVLAVRSGPEARQFVHSLLAASLLDFGGKRTHRPHACGINIGFTFEGLRALGATDRVLTALRKKSPAFAEGPLLRAARYLGDAGESAAERWNPVFQRQRAHVWIAIHGADEADVMHGERQLQQLPGATRGLDGWSGRDAVPDGRHIQPGPGIRMVHFGLRDNITKPSIFDRDRRIGRPGADGRPFQPAPGELLLGYANNAGADVWTADSTPHDVAAFLRNGSFGILRQIRQDEDRLDRYLERQVDALTRQGYRFVTRDYLKAKMSGRWPNGAPVLPGETQQPPAPGPERLQIDLCKDPAGLGCPFGAHIRRANPRSDPLLPPGGRILFRRGIPYTGRTAADERGLLGVFFCARIDDQFELLIAEWLEKNPLGPPNRGRAKDPISGHHDEPDAEFHIPLADGRHIALKSFLPVVRTRGTLYALCPSRRALEIVAAGEYWGLA